MSFTRLTACLACGGSDLWPYLDLGDQPLANAFHDGTAALLKYPLGLQLCRSCFHSMNMVAVDPDLMFKDYPYVSGTSATLREYFKQFVLRVEDQFFDTSHEKLRVLDIASNDGSLLREFKARGHAVCGVDPARNLAPIDIPTIPEYWGDRALLALTACGWSSFDVIVAMNVLGHVADPVGFLRRCKAMLAPGGRIYIQTSQALMVKNGEFDTAYHEHLSFFTVRSFIALADRAGLAVRHISHVPVHGTSYLFELEAPGLRPTLACEDFTVGEAEIGYGYYQIGTYATFAERAGQTAGWARDTIGGLRDAGYAIVGYGAAAKGMTFLNYAGIDLDCILDDNPLKIGKYSPAGPLVRSPDDLGLPDTQPVCWVILAWNMWDEIVAKIKSLRPDRADDRFIAYFPTPRME